MIWRKLRSNHSSPQNPRVTEESTSIVLLGHDAMRTGAPVVLLHLARWLSSHSELDVGVVLLEGGPLLSEYEEVCSTTVINVSGLVTPWELLSRRRRGFGARVMRRLGARLSNSWIRHRIGRVIDGADVVLVNTVISAQCILLDPSRWSSTRLVLYLHEMEEGIRVCGSPIANRLDMPLQEYVSASIRLCDLCIVPSLSAKSDLLRWLSVDSSMVDVVHPCIDIRSTCERADASAPALDALDSSLPLVIGSGIPGWRKGIDLFVQLALLTNVSIPVQFMWVGGKQGGDLRRAQLDAARCGISDRIIFVPEVANPFPLFKAADAFALTSREDPFPLVCLEAAALGTPILCFDSSGTAEFVREKECGIVVRHLDVPTMAREAGALLRSPDRLRDMSKRAQLAAECYDVDIICESILRRLKSIL